MSRVRSRGTHVYTRHATGYTKLGWQAKMRLALAQARTVEATRCPDCTTLLVGTLSQHWCPGSRSARDYLLIASWRRK